MSRNRRRGRVTPGATHWNVEKLKGYSVLAEKLLLDEVDRLGEVARMQAKKRTQPETHTRSEDTKTPRPMGMQTMGPTLYEQIRRVLVELKLVSDN
jgi:hypothetical protein